MAAKKKKRGAQPRNLNALKHGFYSSQFKSKEVEDLEAYLRDGLADEIALMRVITRRVVEMGEKVEDLDRASELLSTLGLAATRLAGLLKVQRIIGGDDSEVTKSISDALTKVLEEWERI